MQRYVKYSIYTAVIFMVGCPGVDYLVILDFGPTSGYQGTLVTIEGAGFSTTLSDNHVRIGGVDAVVVSATNVSLEALVGIGATTGPIEVSVAGGTPTTSANDFTLLDWPAADSGLDGPPIFYARPVGGAPKIISAPGPAARDLPSTGTIRVLVVPSYPTDVVPANLATERQNIADKWDDVHTFYDQASYGTLNVQADDANWVQLCGTFNDYIDVAGANIDNAMLDRFTAECAQGAEDQGFDMDDYDAMACFIWVNGTFLRAWGGWSRDNFAFSGCSGVNININVGHQVNLMALGEIADWGRCAHELGHNIVSTTLTGILGEDVYGSDLVDSSSATATSFDIMGSCDWRALFSGDYMHQLGYYDNANIVELQWDRNPFQQDYTVVAHGTTQDSTANNRYHLIRIAVAGGLYYYVEVRQRPPAGSAQIFDANIPLNGAVNNGGVIVTKVITDEVNNNQQMRHITLLHDPHVLTAGDSVTEPARALEISVLSESVDTDDRLVCDVRVEWAQEMEPDVDADFNLWIEPWGAGYETPDIWIDREPWGTYDTTDGAGNPTGNGDKPQPLAINHFWARAHCQGVDTDNVLVHYYAITPPGVGDNGAWTPLPHSPIHFGTITAGNDQTDFTDWTPAVGEHTCLQVIIQNQLGENSYADNKAQENVFEFEAPAGSVPNPIKIPMAVRNPRNERSIVFVGVDGVPEGYMIQVPHHWVYLDALGELEMEAIVVPLVDIDVSQEQVQTNLVFSGWLPRAYTESIDSFDPASWMMPVGGFTAQVRPKHRSTIELTEDQERSNAYTLAVMGAVNPVYAGQPIVVRVVDPHNRTRATNAMTDTAGQFLASFDLRYAPSDDPVEGKPGPAESPVAGDYYATAYIISAPDLAQAESQELLIKR